MITRKEYMDNATTEMFHKYNEQFVTDYVIEIVRKAIGEDRIKASNNEYFNDIPLKEWDNIFAFGLPSDIKQKLKEVGDFDTSAGRVCIAKQAAWMIKEGRA